MEGNILGIPITLVSGFLGAGKTTLINQVLSETKVNKNEIIIIENEFGEIGIDHDFLIHTDDKVFQLNNGCMCCIMQSDIEETFRSIVEEFIKKGNTIKKVIIETTGIADPISIIRKITTSNYISLYFYIDTVITIVDAKNFSNYKERFTEVGKQIVAADQLIISKYQKDNRIQSQMVEVIKTINPFAKIKYFLLDGYFSSSDFFDQELFNRFPYLIEDEFNTNDSKLKFSPKYDNLETLNPLHDFIAINLKVTTKYTKKLWTLWLEWLCMNYGENLYRYKGILVCRDIEDDLYLQGVCQTYDLTHSSKRYKENFSKIVIIGKDLPRKEIEYSLVELGKFM